MRTVVLHKQAFADLLYWSRTDRKMLSKVFELIASTLQTPFQGLGKPEPMKYDFKGYWSRRINDEHRMVYQVTTEEIFILSCKEHYK